MKSKKVIAGILAAAAIVVTPSFSTVANEALPFVTGMTASARELTDNDAIVSGLVYTLDKTNKTAGLDGRYSNVQKIVVPGTITWQGVTYKVTQINSNAFANSQTVYNVDMTKANNLRVIGYKAFDHASGLKTVKFSSNVEEMSAYCFAYCGSLRTFDFNGNAKLGYINTGDFMGCSSLTSITIPSSVKQIYSSAFSNSGITSVKIPNNVTSISQTAFYSCKSLKNITFEASGTNTKLRIGNDAFGKCPVIDTVDLARTNMDASLTTFKDSNKNMRMIGYGANDYTKSLCKKLLQTWGITYNPNGTDASKKASIDALAKKVNSYITYESIAEEGCAAVVLSTGRGTCGGYARAFYNLALAMGVSSKEVLVGGDFHCHAWNYVKVNGKWYNYDCTNAAYCYTDTKYKNYMIANWGSASAHTDPSKWGVCDENQTGASDESNYGNPHYYNYTQYLSDFNLGKRAQ